jgi:hypothetical protein
MPEHRAVAFIPFTTARPAKTQQMKSNRNRRIHLRGELLEQRRLLAADGTLPVLNAVTNPQFDAVISNFAPPVAGQTSGSIPVADLLTEGTGIALTGTNLGSGRLFYSTDNGASWEEVGQVSPTAALVLAANSTTRLFFLPGPETPLNLRDAITFKAWGGGDGLANGQKNVDTLLRPSQTVGLVNSPDAAVATAVAPNGQFAVTAERGGGITIVDLTNPGDEPLARLAIPGAAVSVAISADCRTAYIAADYGGLQIVDVSTPSQPQLTASVATTGYALGVAIAGSRYLFVAASGAGLDIVDLQAASGPAAVKNLQLGDYALSVAASETGRYAYIGTATAGLILADCLNASSPQVLTSVPTGGSVEGVAVHPSGHHVLAACSQAGLRVIQVSTPTTATIVRTVQTAGRAWGVAIAANGRKGYVSLANTGGVEVLNLTTPSQAAIVGAIHATGFTTGLSVSPDSRYVVVADGSNGTRVVDTLSPQRTQLVDIGGDAGNVTITPDANFAFVTSDTDGLVIIDIRTSQAASVVGKVETGRSAVDLTLSSNGRYAYVADVRDGFVIIDAGNRSEPRRIWNFASPSPPVAIQASSNGRFAAMAHRMGGFVVYDVATNPARPIEWGRIATLLYVTGLAITSDGKAVAVTEQDGDLKLYDTTSSGKPTLLANLRLPGTAQAVEFAPDGKIAYVAAGESGLHIVDLTDFAAPKLLATYASEMAIHGITVSEDGLQLYASTDEGVAILLAKQDALPVLVGILETPGPARGTVLATNASTGSLSKTAVIASGSSGLFLRDVTPPTGFSLESSLIATKNYGTVEDRGSIQLSRDAGGNWRANAARITPSAGGEGLLQLWRPAEAETIADTNVLFARHLSGTMHRLIADSDWTLIGFSGISNVDSHLLLAEARAGQQPPAPPAAPAADTLPIDVAGIVMLRRTINGEMLANDTPLTRDGAAISLSSLEGLRPLAAESLPEGNRLLLRAADGGLVVWRFNAAWQFTEAVPAVPADSLAASLLSQMFGL